MTAALLPGRILPLVTLLMLLVLAPATLRAAGEPAEFLPPASCGGWKLEGKPALYDRETLSDRIDGEAEFYFPYGFQSMAAGRYAGAKDTGAGIDVEIYRMGSLLDAFGMFANYRQREGRPLQLGADSNLAPPQLFLYQGPYFVHIQATGTEHPEADLLAACGREIAARLPGKGVKPAELSALERRGLVPGSERYLPQSLLGYDFMGGGVMVDATVGGGSCQLFFLIGNTPQSAAAALERYRPQLAKARVEATGGGAQFLEGVDQLYGPVTVYRKGGCVAGALKYSDPKGVREFLEGICR